MKMLLNHHFIFLNLGRYSIFDPLQKPGWQCGIGRPSFAADLATIG